jgi:endonuclease/exonuclease/phosphatase family metal-dependent hydrolase
MIRKTHSLLRGFLVLINIGVILLYLSVCLVPFINTGKLWMIALPGLAFPLLFVALVCFILLWLIFRSRWFWICLVVLLLGFQQITSVFSFHLFTDFTIQKQPNTLRVLHWNVESWDDSSEKPKEKDDSYRPQMMALLKEQNADVLCFEEYADIKNLADSNSNVSWIRKMGFPHYLYAQTEMSGDSTQQGVIIFSKYPIIHSDTFNYGPNSHAEHLIFADIKIGNKTFRIFTTHLQSVRFEYHDYESLTRLKHAKDPGYHDSRTIVSKLKAGYEHRYSQAQIVKQKIAQSPYPVIITGDFNDVPNSNTYFTIKGKLLDSFLKKGSGIGRTFRFISPTLRIDYILADKSLEVNQFRVIHVPYSDHFPVETDLKY